MNEKALHTLEFDKIVGFLTEYAATPLGKDSCRDLVPLTDLEEIRTMQRQTSDAVSRLFAKGPTSFSGVKDIRASLMRLRIGSSLGISELLSISRLLEAASRVKSYGRREQSETDPDSLDGLFSGLEPIFPLHQEIARCIISEEEISDDASPNLRRIRRALAAASEKIRFQLNSMVNSSRTYLQDGVITMRNGRYCLPVKAEHKNQIAGMVHDQSSSGSTFFIEPLAIVKLNNEIRELEISEQKEIEIILGKLSQMAAEYCDTLEDDFHILCKLDFVFARATLSRKWKCSEPNFNEKGFIRIKDGRHPLLDPQKVVPINLELGGSFHQLIITGPNTGGKTVSLKTVGLFTLMGQAGLHIPAFEGSELAVFTEVFADIGDEQSIEQSLSTFSSHMTNIVQILDRADCQSLVLFDELGAGTDPTEGAALATAILTFLHNMQVRTMATTHYSELKVFALSTPGVENACCEFDVATLRPTYRLLIGIPGKSNAFAISKRLGLPQFIIDDASARLDKQDVEFEDLLTGLEENRRRLEQEKEEITRYKNEIAELKSKLSAKQDRLEAQRERMLKEASEEASRILAEAKKTADTTIKNINRISGDSGVARELEKEREALRREMEKNNARTAAKKVPVPAGKAIDPKKLRVGDGVKVLSLNLTGTVSTLPNQKGDLYVQMGILRSLVNISDLQLLDESGITALGSQLPAGKRTQKRSSSAIGVGKSASISTELNLIGMTTDEAIPTLDKYLDDAYLAHLPTARIIHGRGTGALKAAVHQMLRRSSVVASYRLGAYGEGSGGVTIVEFKSGKE
ncbi:MAG: endonuclease MutS2 [Lachnospiraceae bacterium]|nr:endonuclease MutS2 [Lachnospiraceae bacterium]